MPFDNGVASYIVGTATVEVCFPVDYRGAAHVCCEMCEFYSRNSVRCRLNGAVCNFPAKYIGAQCPLKFEDSERSGHKCP